MPYNKSHCDETFMKKYPPLDENINIAIYYTQIIFIPIIVFSSVLIIISIRLKKDLQKPHNYILFGIAFLDLLIGVIILPMDAAGLQPLGNIFVYSCSNTCVVLIIMELLLDDISLSYITYMNVDRFLMVIFSGYYSRKCTIPLTKQGLAAIAFIACVSYGFFCVFRLNNGTYICLVLDRFPWGFLVFPGVLISLRVFISLVCSLCVYIYSRKRDLPIVYDTIALLTIYLVLFLPTFVLYMYLVLDHHSQNYKIGLLLNITHLIHYLRPLSTGAVIAWTRPVFRNYFKYILTNSPTKWNINVESASSRTAEERVAKTLENLENLDEYGMSSGSFEVISIFSAGSIKKCTTCLGSTSSRPCIRE